MRPRCSLFHFSLTQIRFWPKQGQHIKFAAQSAPKNYVNVSESETEQIESLNRFFDREKEKKNDNLIINTRKR